MLNSRYDRAAAAPKLRNNRLLQFIQCDAMRESHGAVSGNGLQPNSRRLHRPHAIGFTANSRRSSDQKIWKAVRWTFAKHVLAYVSPAQVQYQLVVESLMIRFLRDSPAFTLAFPQQEDLPDEADSHDPHHALFCNWATSFAMFSPLRQ
jgi:hypothetical protein